VKLRIWRVPLDVFARMAEDPGSALAGVASVPKTGIDWIREVGRQSHDFLTRTGAVEPWTGYLVIDEAAGQVVGTCGFKGNPNEAGEVEIAYGTLPEFEGRGVATVAARELTAVAGRHPAVRRVIAHTLPVPNASGRVLEKAGYRQTGAVVDPEDGEVWRWEWAG